ncbi:hypothetical protein ND808_00420 [Streptomyces sp. DR7-3]|uniref:hypothetical protein n=1 Tax=Streptomyces malaysiensis TaxID=92644 RepID=UPI002042DD64|nr:hypothetical protein [Streptomyces sp. DR7-3]MCM3804352.1 hypothetical protein [Streptomyces sp. DR7-3]
MTSMPPAAHRIIPLVSGSVCVICPGRTGTNALPIGGRAITARTGRLNPRHVWQTTANTACGHDHRGRQRGLPAARRRAARFFPVPATVVITKDDRILEPASDEMVGL